MTDLFLGYPEQSETDWIKKYATPFHFEVLEDGHIQLNKNQDKYNTTPDVSLLYSFDNKNWSDWEHETGTDVIAGQKFYIKAKTENKKFGGKYVTSYNNFSTTGKVNVAGNIMSLLYNSFVSKISFISDSDDINENRFYFLSLFKNCTNLIDASNLILPALITNINDSGTGCYYSMFSSCTSLSATPKFPSNLVGLRSYAYMFYNCSSLIIPPELPATMLGVGAYMFMFYYSNISSISLPTINITDTSYSGMLHNCSNLKEIHYPISISSDTEFAKKVYDFPYIGSPTNPTIYYDL